MQFNKSVLVAEKNKQSAKTLNVYIAYDLDDLPRNSHKNVILKNNLFGATNIVKIVLKVNMFFETIEQPIEWTFCNHFARNVIIFGIGNSS